MLLPHLPLSTRSGQSTRRAVIFRSWFVECTRRPPGPGKISAYTATTSPATVICKDRGERYSVNRGSAAAPLPRHDQPGQRSIRCRSHAAEPCESRTSFLAARNVRRRLLPGTRGHEIFAALGRAVFMLRGARLQNPQAQTPASIIPCRAGSSGRTSTPDACCSISARPCRSTQLWSPAGRRVNNGCGSWATPPGDRISLWSRSANRPQPEINGRHVAAKMIFASGVSSHIHNDP